MPNRILYAVKRRIAPGFRVGRQDLVVDVGSGDKPFWRADVVVDSTRTGAEQRHSRREVVTSLVPFIDCDITQPLPIPDGAFEFSYCAHVLEHLPDPGHLIDELVRVSRRGYVEVPNGLFEVAEPFVSHLWLVFREGDRLVFVRKTRRLHVALDRNRVWNARSHHRVLKEPFIRIYWEGRLEYEIVDEPVAGAAYEVDLSLDHAGTSEEFPALYWSAVRLLRRFFHHPKPPPPWLESAG